MAWLGRFAVRYRYAVIAAWVVITVVCVVSLPKLGSIVNSDNSSFLPSASPVQQAGRLASAFQPAHVYTTILVAERGSGPLTPADQDAITRAETAAGTVNHVLCVRDQGISADGQARKASIGLNVSPSDTHAGGVVDALRASSRRRIF